MSKSLLSLVGPPEQVEVLPVGSVGVVPNNHPAFASLTQYAVLAAPGSVVTHPDFIHQAIQQGIAHREALYDQAISATKALLGNFTSSSFCIRC